MCVVCVVCMCVDEYVCVGLGGWITWGIRKH